VVTEAQLRRKLLREGCSELSESGTNIRFRLPNGDYRTIPKGIIGGSYTLEQFLEIEKAIEYYGLDLLPLDWV